MLSKPGTDQKYKSISEQESKFDSETISEKNPVGLPKLTENPEPPAGGQV